MELLVMSGPVEKVCIDCGKSFPDTDEWYTRKGSGKLDSRCKSCRKIVRRAKKKKEREGTMASIEAGAMHTFLKAAAQGGENIPHSSELLERMMEYFGGTSGFSALAVKQYFDSPPGSATRTKMIETVLRLVVKNTEMGGAKKPMTQWTDEELETELDDRLRRVAAQYQGRIVDVTPQTPSDFAAAFGSKARLIPAEPVEGDSGRTGKQEDRGVEAVPADAATGGDARLQGE
jgi:hypothetical protein